MLPSSPAVNDQQSLTTPLSPNGLNNPDSKNSFSLTNHIPTNQATYNPPGSLTPQSMSSSMGGYELASPLMLAHSIVSPQRTQQHQNTLIPPSPSNHQYDTSGMYSSTPGLPPTTQLFRHNSAMATGHWGQAGSGIMGPSAVSTSTSTSGTTAGIYQPYSTPSLSQTSGQIAPLLSNTQQHNGPPSVRSPHLSGQTLNQISTVSGLTSSLHQSKQSSSAPLSLTNHIKSSSSTSSASSQNNKNMINISSNQSLFSPTQQNTTLGGSSQQPILSSMSPASSTTGLTSASPTTHPLLSHHHNLVSNNHIIRPSSSLNTTSATAITSTPTTNNNNNNNNASSLSSTIGITPLTRLTSGDPLYGTPSLSATSNTLHILPNNTTARFLGSPPQQQQLPHQNTQLLHHHHHHALLQQQQQQQQTPTSLAQGQFLSPSPSPAASASKQQQQSSLLFGPSSSIPNTGSNTTNLLGQTALTSTISSNGSVAGSNTGSTQYIFHANSKEIQQQQQQHMHLMSQNMMLSQPHNNNNNNNTHDNSTQSNGGQSESTTAPPPARRGRRRGAALVLEQDNILPPTTTRRSTRTSRATSTDTTTTQATTTPDIYNTNSNGYYSDLNTATTPTPHDSGMYNQYTSPPGTISQQSPSLYNNNTGRGHDDDDGDDGISAQIGRRTRGKYTQQHTDLTAGLATSTSTTTTTRGQRSGRGSSTSKLVSYTEPSDSEDFNDDDDDDDDDYSGHGGRGRNGPMGQEDKVKMRLARKAKLARESRKRKKYYVNDLERSHEQQGRHIVSLTQQIEELKSQLKEQTTLLHNERDRCASLQLQVNNYEARLRSISTNAAMTPSTPATLPLQPPLPPHDITTLATVQTPALSRSTAAATTSDNNNGSTTTIDNTTIPVFNTLPELQPSNLQQATYGVLPYYLSNDEISSLKQDERLQRMVLNWRFHDDIEIQYSKLCESYRKQKLSDVSLLIALNRLNNDNMPDDKIREMRHHSIQQIDLMKTHFLTEYFYLTRAQKYIEPPSVLQFAIWGMTQPELFHTKSRTMWTTLMIDELKLDDIQIKQFMDNKHKFESIKSDLLSIRQLFNVLSEHIRVYNTKTIQLFQWIQYDVFKPIQALKFYHWVSKNLYVMSIIGNDLATNNNNTTTNDVSSTSAASPVPSSSSSSGIEQNTLTPSTSTQQPGDITSSSPHTTHISQGLDIDPVLRLMGDNAPAGATAPLPNTVHFATPSSTRQPMQQQLQSSTKTESSSQLWPPINSAYPSSIWDYQSGLSASSTTITNSNNNNTSNTFDDAMKMDNNTHEHREYHDNDDDEDKDDELYIAQRLNRSLR